MLTEYIGSRDTGDVSRPLIFMSWLDFPQNYNKMVTMRIDSPRLESYFSCGRKDPGTQLLVWLGSHVLP